MVLQQLSDETSFNMSPNAPSGTGDSFIPKMWLKEAVRDREETAYSWLEKLEKDSRATVSNIFF